MLSRDDVRPPVELLARRQTSELDVLGVRFGVDDPGAFMGFRSVAGHFGNVCVYCNNSYYNESIVRYH